MQDRDRCTVGRWALMPSGLGVLFRRCCGCRTIIQGSEGSLSKDDQNSEKRQEVGCGPLFVEVDERAWEDDVRGFVRAQVRMTSDGTSCEIRFVIC